MNQDHPMTRMMADNVEKFLVLILWKMCPKYEVRLSTADMEKMMRDFAGQVPTIAAIGEPEAVTLRLLNQDGVALVMASPDASLNDPKVMAMEKMYEVRDAAPGIANEIEYYMEGGGAGGPPISKDLLRRATEALRILSDKGGQ